MTDDVPLPYARPPAVLHAFARLPLLRHAKEPPPELQSRGFLNLSAIRTGDYEL